jgi:PBSX family phage terminase large subunit
MFDKDKHVIDSKGLPPRFSEIYCASDYGTGNPTVFLAVGRVGNSFYVMDEYYFDSREARQQKTDSQYSKDFKEFAQKYPKYLGLAVDPSAASFIVQLLQDNVRVNKARNDVLDGIRRVSSLLEQGRLFIAGDRCPNLLRELVSYVWDPKAQQLGEDKPLKVNDHAPDALRYCIYTFWRSD